MSKTTKRDGANASSDAREASILSAERDASSYHRPTSPYGELESHPMPDTDKAMHVQRYLVTPDDQSTGADGNEEPDGTASALNASAFSAASGRLSSHEDEYQAPHHMQGGAITEDVYRWAHQNRPRPRRSESVFLPRTRDLDSGIDSDILKQPGGFRRSYVMTHAAEQGKPPPRALKSFVEFLMLYGHFAGEELNDYELDMDDDDDGDGNMDEEAQTAASPSETTPLVRRRRVHGAIPSFRGRRRHEHKGEASVLDAVLMLLKSFIGTGILFLGKAFFNGGLLFSTAIMCLIAGISLWSFLLLVQTNQKLHVGFGEMGGILYGSYMRNAILASIVVSQLGFVAAYTVFVAENMQALILSLTQCRTLVSHATLIVAQALVFLPLSLVRKIAKLSSTALIADVFILAGIVYLFYYEIGSLATYGFGDVVMFNSKNFPLFIGTAVFTFEGVGLVIPITESMKEPRKFPATLSWVMLVVTVLFAASGALSYATFGSETQTVVITNLPGNSRFVQAIQALYSIAILLSMPLQLFPALTILELGLFKRSGKFSLRTKMLKNSFRFATVVLAMFAAWLGANDLDKFVSLIGSVACVPLCFIYPPLLHLRACAFTHRAKVMDILLFTFGIFCVVFAGSQTLQSMLSGSSPPKPPVCVPPK